MIIHPGNHVDTNGRCYHPYLAYWTDNIGSSSLVGFAKVLSDAFSKEPPVYARASAPQASGSSYGNTPTSSPGPGSPGPESPLPQLPPPPPPPPPLPPHPSHPAPPSLPPHPHTEHVVLPSSRQTQPSPAGSGSNAIYQQYFPNSHQTQDQSHGQVAYRSPPPPPPPLSHPPVVEREGYQYQHLQEPQQHFQQPLQPPQQPPLQPPHQNGHNYSLYTQQPSLQYTTLPHPVYRSPPPTSLHPPQPHKPVLDIMDSEIEPTSITSKETSTNQNNLSASSPIKPPNPEKLAALQHLSDQLNAIIETIVKPEIATDEQAIFQTKELLDWVDNTVNNEKLELERILSSVQRNEPVIRERIDQAKRVTHEAKSRAEPKIDEVVCAENIVFNQLYDVATDDLAIDDTLYILDKALDNGRLKIDNYLKHTRSLAREQFMKRALSNKIASIAQLSGGSTK